MQLPQGEAAQAFRHTYAKDLLEAGVSLPVLQRLLGHKVLKTTSVYLQLTARQGHEHAVATEIGNHLRVVSALPPSSH